jgi:hypothetical protein
MMAMVVNLFLFGLIALGLWIGMRLFATAHDNRVTSLYWLVALFFINVVALPFAPAEGNPLGGTPASPWLFSGGLVLTQFVVILFTVATFYQNRKSPAEWFWGLTLVAGVATLYGIAISASPYAQSAWVASIQIAACANWAWLGWAGYKAWRTVANVRAVEDWVKARYQIVLWFAVFQVIGALTSFARVAFFGEIAANPNRTLLALVALVCNMITVVLAYFAWAAPQGYYRWLNRNFKPQEPNTMNEDEVMRRMTMKKK